MFAALLALLTAIAAAFGYLIGWAFQNEVSDNFLFLSPLGLGLAAIMATASVGWSLISLAFGGNGVARLDGFVLFVRRGLPGDLVRARVTKVKRNHAEALVHATEKQFSDNASNAAVTAAKPAVEKAIADVKETLSSEDT